MIRFWAGKRAIWRFVEGSGLRGEGPSLDSFQNKIGRSSRYSSFRSMIVLDSLYAIHSPLSAK